MAQTKFEISDIVILKSGGPEMTIYEILTKKHSLNRNPPTEREVNSIKTKWFDGTKLEYGQFLETDLKFIRKEDDGFIQ